MEWYIKVLKNYANFSGRARRKEYWMFFLCNSIIQVLLVMIDLKTGTGMLFGLYAVAVIMPGFSVGVRRLHDIGKSGWWMFITFVPIIGGILLLVYLCKDSQQEENSYGPNPKLEVA